MGTIYDIKKRSEQLAAKTDAESISPAEVGGLFYDLAEYTGDVEINGATLGIRKTYTSISEMEADLNPTGDDGKPLKKGMLVNIYNQDEPDNPDNNKVFSWQNPGWLLRTKVDAGYATRAELEDLADTVAKNVVAIEVDRETGDITATYAGDNSAFVSGELTENGDLTLKFEY